MEISLEQIELVKDRTGSSYKEAKEALEFANGNVVDAIIYIEENISFDAQKSAEKNGVDKVIGVMKDAIRTGNVTKVKVYKNDEVILNIPVTVGTVATIVFPWGMVAAAIATAATGCKIELVKEDGSVVDVNAKAEEAYGTVKEKGEVIFDEIKAKGTEIYNDAVEKGTEVINEAVEKGTEVYENTKDKVTEFIDENIKNGGK